MNYNFTEITYPSSNGKNTAYAEIYTPKTGTVRGIVQLAHGMIDYVGRYRALAEYLTSCGFVFAGNHHLGHGKTAKGEEDFGFFASKGGVSLLLEDMHTLNKYLRNEYPTLPLFLLGHSMGSFLARLYVTKHPHTVRGVIFHGTAGPNPALPAGRLLGKLIRAMRGERYRPSILRKLSIGAYEKKFLKTDGKNGWLTRDIDRVSDRDTDSYTAFSFTVSAYVDLFSMLGACNKKSWYKAYPKNLCTLLISGECDPVGSFGKGVRTVYKNLLIAGCTDVELRMYGGARHELFNETNREEVFEHINDWLTRTEQKTRLTF